MLAMDVRSVGVICVMLGMWGCAAAVCEVWESVPANTHMCYWLAGEEEVEVERDVFRRKWVLEEPASCKSPFPCFGVVREVVEVEKVPVRVSVCQLEPMWNQARPMKHTYSGVTLVLSPGYFTKRNFTRQLMCLWNISCQDETQILFVNYTGDDHLANQSTEDSACDGEYVVVEWEGGQEVGCGEQQGPWLHNEVFPHNLKVVFKSSGVFEKGLRLDTACYAPTPNNVSPDTNCTSLLHVPSQGHETLQLSPTEVKQLNDMFSLHMELHMLMDACSESVEDCGVYYSRHMNPELPRELEEVAEFANLCSPLIYSMQNRTLSMYGY